MSYAIITGASKGIGLAIAKELAKRKINVLLIARSENLLRQETEKIKAEYKVETDYLAIDLTSPNAAQQIVDWCSLKDYPIHILINNAGYGLSGAFENYPLDEHRNMMQLNMHVPVELSYLLLPQLKKQASFIMNIASGAAYQAVPGLNVYAASKAFMLSFSRGLRYELKNSSVSVTAVSPGATETDFPNRAKVDSPKAKKMAERFNMQPIEVAKMAVDGLFAKKSEVVTGFVNKLAVFFAWLLPKSTLEKSAASIYDL
jgi:short-subunit dehydrogenase